MPTQIIHLHRDAPAKPAPGEPCNRCGVCCAAEPCPAGIVVFRQKNGPCPALNWTGENYSCGLVTAPEQLLGWLPMRGRALAARLFARWIAAGKGCDSMVESPEVE